MMSVVFFLGLCSYIFYNIGPSINYVTLSGHFWTPTPPKKVCHNTDWPLPDKNLDLKEKSLWAKKQNKRRSSIAFDLLSLKCESIFLDPPLPVAQTYLFPYPHPPPPPTLKRDILFWRPSLAGIAGLR